MSGTIELLKYENFEDRTWPVYSNCKFVRIRSIMFETENKYDNVTIGNSLYNGKKQIDIIQSSNFTVAFRSDERYTDKGFILTWNCLTQWEEWEATKDGTCREFQRLKPDYKGSDVKHQTKYRKTNETCRE